MPNKIYPYFSPICEVVYLLQQLNKRVHGSVRFRRAGHMHVQLIAISQCIQTQNKCHIVMEQARLWLEKVWTK